jgi:HSP20 family protein
MAAKDDDQKKKEEEEVEVDFGIGKISFGGLFQGIGSLIDLVSKMEEEGKGEVNRAREFTSPSGRVKAVYGFSVKTGLGGKPTVEPFGNVRRTPRGPVVEEEREPLVDVFDEKDHVLVIIELPGVAEEQIRTTVNGDILTLSATDGGRKYYKEVVLPKDVDAGTLTSSYKNGVLEIRMSKK